MTTIALSCEFTRIASLGPDIAQEELQLAGINTALENEYGRRSALVRSETTIDEAQSRIDQIDSQLAILSADDCDQFRMQSSTLMITDREESESSSALVPSSQVSQMLRSFHKEETPIEHRISKEKLNGKL